MLILSTWTFGQPANSAAWPALSRGGSSLDAVEAACRYAESDLTNPTVGKGGRPDASGQVSLDASIMLSPARCGGVAYIRKYEHPVSIARKVMEDSPHVLLAGEGAERFAAAHGFTPAELLTDVAQHEWETWRNKQAPSPALRNIEERSAEAHDTIGVLSIDANRLLAGACSTSGIPYKLPGRVGDSPIIGHALYVDPQHGAAVATGHGELVMSVCGAFLAVEFLRRGASPTEAALEVAKRIRDTQPLTPQDQAGLIVLKPDGTWGAGSVREGFKVSVRNAERDEVIGAEYVLGK